jgi:hypothetical protein
MTRFCVGEKVVIRFGERTGQKATILKVQPRDVYRVRAEDTAVLTFTSKGLEGEREYAQHSS